MNRRVRLYEREGIWWASYTANGRTVRRSTRATTEEKARESVAAWPLDGPATFKFDEDGIIYFVEATGLDRVKIGWTRLGKLWKRIAELQIGCPVQLRVLASYRGLMMHEHLEHCRFRSSWLHGEWFVLTEDLRAHIQNVENANRGPLAYQEQQVHATKDDTER